MKINYAGEDMYLFDLQAVECFIPQHRDPATGKIPRPKAVLPEEWNEGFGMSVEEHEDSTKVDLDSGFTEAMAGEDKPVMNPTEQNIHVRAGPEGVPVNRYAYRKVCEK